MDHVLQISLLFTLRVWQQNISFEKSTKSAENIVLNYFINSDIFKNIKSLLFALISFICKIFMKDFVGGGNEIPHENSSHRATPNPLRMQVRDRNLCLGIQRQPLQRTKYH